MKIETNIYLEECRNYKNLLYDYFEMLSKDIKKPQIWADLYGQTEIERSKSVLFLLSFLLIKVYKYSFEEALENVDSNWFIKHKITPYGIGKLLKIRTTYGFLDIFQYRYLILSIIYNNWNIEKDLFKIYECQYIHEQELGKVENQSVIIKQYFKISKLLGLETP